MAALEDRNFSILFLRDPKDSDILYPVNDLLFWREQAMQFDWELHNWNSTEAPLLLPNGTWTGFAGAMNRGEFDILNADTILSAHYWDNMEFNYPHHYDDITFATNKPRYTPEIMAIFRTLSLSVWIALLVSIVTFTLVSFVALKHRCTLADVLFHVLAVGLNQEGNIVPKRTGEVVLLFTWMLAMLLFSFCFKSVLLSFLSFPPLISVRTVPELAAAIRSGKIKAAASSHNFGLTLMQSPNEDLRVIGEDVLRRKIWLIDDLVDGEHDGYAFVTIRSLVQFSHHDLFISDDSLGFLMAATVVRKDFCCKAEMDAVVHRFMAAGAHLKPTRLVHHLMDMHSSRNMPDDETLRKITLTDVSAAFIFLAVGYFISACVLVVELWLNSRQRRHSLAKKNNFLSPN